MLGTLLLTRGDADEAAEAFSALVRNDPDTARSHVHLADALYVLGRYPEALGSYLTAVEIDPTSYDANVGAGTTLVKLDRSAEATPYLSAATDLDPRSLAAWRQTAMAMLAVGNLDKASLAVGRVLELAPANDPRRVEDLLLAADVAGAAGRSRLAEDRLEQAGRLRPNDVEVQRRQVVLRLSIAERARVAGRDAEAASAYRRAEDAINDLLLTSPNDAQAWSTLGSTRLRLWDLGGRINAETRENAVAAWSRSLELDATQDDVRQAIEQWSR